MHNAAFRALGLAWTYEVMDVSPDGLHRAIALLRAPDVAGANVTIPYKQAVMDHMDVVEPEAIRARAVNTVVKVDGRLEGSNTDVAGIHAAIEEVGIEAKGANAVILGSGGSARAAAVALEGAHLTFVSRHPESADLPGRSIGWTTPHWPASCAPRTSWSTPRRWAAAGRCPSARPRSRGEAR